MDFKFLNIVVCFFTWEVCLIKCDNNVLLFNRDSNMLVDMQMIEKVPEEFKYCAVACAASAEKEFKFNEENSVGRNALFVEKILRDNEAVTNINSYTCKESFKPSVTFNVDANSIDIGYEIHCKEGIDASLLSMKPHNNFLSLYPAHSTESSDPKDILLRYLETTEESLPERKSLDFIWIQVLQIWYDIDAMNPMKIEYTPDLGDPRSSKNCKQYDVGIEFFTAKSLSALYSKENQLKIFTGRNTPPSPQTENQPAFQCGQKYGCLTLHQIIPTYYYHSYAGKIATCTYMNTIPVWESIEKKINRVDRYLYAMSQIWSSNLRITNGTLGIVKPSKAYFKNIPVSRQELYLDQENFTVPVPQIFYKMVEYRVPTGDGLSDLYYALIVIHNDPSPDGADYKICQEKGQLRGWNGIVNKKLQTGLIYVCRITDGIMVKLGLSEFQGYKREIPALRLDKFPVFEIEKNFYSYVDKRKEISKKIKQLWRKSDESVV